MKQALIITGAALAALLPAGFGLAAAGPALSATVPIDAAQAVPIVIPVDDSPTHDAGDDRGGATKAERHDDPAGHDAGDDKGGASGKSGKSGKSSSGRSGGDDGKGHDAGDDHGGHGSDD